MARAEKTGKLFEEEIESKIKETLNCDKIEYKDVISYNGTYPVLVTNVPYHHPYEEFLDDDTKRRFCKTEFGLYDETKKCKIRIECKYQNTTGSTDNKLAYLYEVASTWKEDHSIIVVGGKNAKSNVNYKALDAKIKNKDTKLKYIKHDNNIQLFNNNITGFTNYIKNVFDIS